MGSGEIGWLTATELSARTTGGELTVTDVAKAMIERVEKINPKLNAIIDFRPEQVLQDAKQLDLHRRNGENLGSLHGVPFTIKDLTAVKDRPLTFGMVPMKDNIATKDAVIVARLRESGALFLGKTNTPESGYYGVTDNHLFGPTHNPWKHGYCAGGSSGGAAAAVAAGLGPLAEGSDGAGSVRIPSALCGVVGLKPSTGRVPQTILAGRYYRWAYHGPITRTVEDNALMLDAINGPSSCDPLSLPYTRESYREAVRGDITGLRVAWSPDLGLGYVDPEVMEICKSAVAAFGELGAQVTEATPAWGNPQEAMWHGIWVPGLGSEHDMFDWSKLRGQVDDNLIELMNEGERVTAVDIGRADVFCGTMWETFAAFMSDYDVLVSPTVATAAFPLGQFTPSWLDGKTLREQLLGWLLTYPFNMLTTPAISVPAGFTSDGLPVGLQLAGSLHADATVLRAAANFESARPWANHKPPVAM
jgi:aspartyl-tRNA(Asn)/glutamyl-tRNA(Gln) amidotransferase subunit A